ncbi:MAG: cyclic nucleotide-binding domain-containing protein [Treponema sp.]|jgi:CRP-like cAMP-binding protein|nr:cyclic nucleotide-binding domain-containing protein [Treponema sp.]
MADLQLAFVNFKQNAYIVVEGHTQIADRFFIIRAGKVRVTKSAQVIEEEGGNILGPGDFFSVVSTMSSHLQIETVQAITDVTLISVHKEQYSQLIKNNAPVAMKIIMQFSKRMRYLDEALARITLKSATTEDPAHLFNIAQYYIQIRQYEQAYYAYHQYIKYCPNAPDVDRARDIMAKISRYVHGVRFDYKPDELVRSYPKNTMLFCENEPGDELFIIQKGSVKITKIQENKEVLLAVLKTGDIFGEMALLESKPRSASAIAYEDCTVMAVNRANFQQMVSSQPQIIARLTTLLAERIWLIYKQLANTLIEDRLGRAYDMLLMQLERNRINVNSPQAYLFDFGPKELVTMLGLPQSDGSSVIAKLIENKFIQIRQDKIFVQNISEISKEVEMFKRLQAREDYMRSRGAS